MKHHKVLRELGKASLVTHYQDPESTGERGQRMVTMASQKRVLQPCLGLDQPQEIGFPSQPGTLIYMKWKHLHEEILTFSTDNTQCYIFFYPSPICLFVCFLALQMLVVTHKCDVKSP